MFASKIRPKAHEAKQVIRDIFTRLQRFHKAGNKLQRRRLEEPAQEPAGEQVPPLATPEVTTALRVTVTTRFDSPMDYVYTRTYESSPGFEATTELCDLLKTHVETRTKEYITRDDVEASEPLLKSLPYTKTARYHVIVRIDRHNQPYSEKHFVSFQEQPIVITSAHQTILELDRMVALFFQRHDSDFKWNLPDIVSLDPMRQVTYKPIINMPQPLSCIPTYTNTAGYSIDVYLKSKHQGHNNDWVEKVESTQSSPLTLSVGEELMTNVARILGELVEEQESIFDEVHSAECNGQEGTYGCTHYEKDSFDIWVKFNNKLGPNHPHLYTRLKSYRVLFRRGDVVSINDFAESLRGRLGRARDKADRSMNSLDDLKIHIHELFGNTWRVRDPLIMKLGREVTEDRKTITALLGRIESGIKHELKGQETSVLITVHKRGHLILDTIIHGGPSNNSDGRFDLLGSSDLKKTRLPVQILERLRGDIALVCYDTYDFDGLDPLAHLKVITPETALQRLVSSTISSGSLPPRPSRPLFRQRRSSNLRELELQSRSRSPTERGRSRIPRPILRSVEDARDTQADTRFVREFSYLSSIITGRAVSSTSSTPSLVDTASIVTSSEGPETPNVTPERVLEPKSSTGIRELIDTVAAAQVDAAQYVSGDDSYMDDDTVIHHTSYLGEARNTLLANVDTLEAESRVEAYDHGSIQEQAVDESIAEDSEDPLALALLGPKKDRRPTSDHMEDKEQMPAWGNVAKASSAITAIYSLPNRHINDDSQALEAAPSAILHPDPTTAPLDGSSVKKQDKGKAVVRRNELGTPTNRVKSMCHRFAPRSITPPVTATTARSLVHASGSIQRQVSSQTHSRPALARGVAPHQDEEREPDSWMRATIQSFDSFDLDLDIF